MLGEDDLLGPLEGMSVLIVGGNEGVDLLSYLARGGEAGTGQGMTGEDGKPDLHLVQPGGVGRGEVMSLTTWVYVSIFMVTGSLNRASGVPVGAP
jgi:hypothetical protein